MDLSFVSTLELLQEVQKRFDTSVLILQKSKTEDHESITVAVKGDRWRSIGILAYATTLVSTNVEQSVSPDPDLEDFLGSESED
jgi:hypothetical protein